MTRECVGTAASRVISRASVPVSIVVARMAHMRRARKSPLILESVGIAVSRAMSFASVPANMSLECMEIELNHERLKVSLVRRTHHPLVITTKM